MISSVTNMMYDCDLTWTVANISSYITPVSDNSQASPSLLFRSGQPNRVKPDEHQG